MFTILVGFLLVLLPIIYNLITSNTDFFEEALRTFGNTFDVVISSFQIFNDIGAIMPGRLYPIYAFAIGIIITCFVLSVLHFLIQIIGSALSFI